MIGMLMSVTTMSIPLSSPFSSFFSASRPLRANSSS